MVAKHWISLGWSSHLEGNVRRHLGSSMRPPFVPLVCSLQHTEEHRLHKFEGGNMLENNMVK